MSTTGPAPALVCPGCGSPDVDLRRGLLCGTCAEALDAEAVPGVTRYRVREPIFIEAIQRTGDNEEAIRAFAGDFVITPLGCYLARGVTGHLFTVDSERFAATYEPAGEPLSAAQCDRLDQMAGEWGDALSVVREALDFAAAKAWTGEQGAVVARAREALKVLSGEEGADHG